MYLKLNWIIRRILNMLFQSTRSQSVEYDCYWVIISYRIFEGIIYYLQDPTKMQSFYSNFIKL